MTKPETKIVLPEIVNENFENKWIAGLPIEHYHSDKTAVSSTGVRYALKTPRKFFYAWTDPYGEKEDDETDSMRLGNAAHCAILEPMEFDRRFIAMPDFGDMRSSTNRAKRDEWKLSQPAGALILPEKEVTKLKRIIDNLLRNSVAVNLIKGAAFEQSAYFRDPETGLKCRIRPDIIRLDLSAMPDLKTCRDASPSGFSRAIWERRYHVQLAFYAHGVKAIHGKEPGTRCIIACENQDDHDVCVYELDPAMNERGDLSVKKGLARIAEGVKTGLWSGYQKQAEMISLPGWTDFIED